MSAVGAFTRLAGIIGIAFGGAEIVRAGDAWTNIYSRIGLVTKSTAEQVKMQEEVFNIAQRTRQSYEETGALFTRIGLAAQNLGTSHQDALDITETVNKALVIGGASAMEARSTVLQLSQALASGVLQGEELRALRESAPILLQEIANYYGVTIGALKEMGREGKLTASGVAVAIVKAKAKIDKQFGKMPVTIEQSVNVALNRIMDFIFKINQETGIFQKIAKGIVKSVDGIISSIEMAIKFVGGFTKAVKLLILSLAALKVAMFVFAYPVTWLPRLIIYVTRLRNVILLTSRSLWALALNPVFWKAALIAAGIILIVLAIEDLYGWITGADSLLGRHWGTWENFLNNLKLTAQEIKNILLNKDSFESFWGNFFNYLKGIAEQMRRILLYKEDFLSFLNSVIETSPLLMGIRELSAKFGGTSSLGGVNVTATSMVHGLQGANNYVFNQTFDTNLAISSNQPVTQTVGNAIAEIGNESMGKFSRGMTNISFGTA